MDEALELCDEILRMIEEDVPERAHDKAPDFFEGVEEKVKSISETIEQSGQATDRQIAALENMQAAVSKWIR